MNNVANEISEESTSVESKIITWKDVLKGEREKEYFQSLLMFIETEIKSGKVIYPPKKDIFNTLTLTPFAEVRVVIIGQDPYHGPNQAHGLAFSVRKGIPPPPSLVNIFKELETDVHIPPPPHGCLEKWATEGVLLLNTALTVEQFRPQSHAKLGWENFTDRIISELSQRKSGLVFLLWGSNAINKAQGVDKSKHHILTAPHPSPLSAYRGFLGCRHFSKTNELLKAQGQREIDWRIE